MVGCRALRAAALSLLVLLVTAAPASARERTFAVHGAPAAGPARYDRTFVTRFGPASARTVLVLVPGTVGGAGNFTLLARDLVRRVPGLQVWAWDRRDQALEDHSGFRGPGGRRATAQEAFDFYLGWLANPAITRHFRPLDPRRNAFAGRWGLKVELDDLHRVIARARRGGRRVLLGGHSAGASAAVAYAAWDFGGRAGFRDLDGLVLIDGGLLGSFTVRTLAGVKRALAEIRTKGPWDDLLGLGVPWAAQLFAEVGGQAAARSPHRLSPFQAFPLLPAFFRPPVPATNSGILGFALDADTAPAALSLIQVRAGRLGADGDWRDGEVSPIARVAAMFGAERPVDGWQWYYPRRLRIEIDAAQALRRNAQTRLLGLRPFHRAGIDVPLYAFQTSLSRGRVLAGARALIARSRIPRRRSVLVDGSREQSHLDPLVAAPARDRFLRTVVPFLRRAQAGAGATSSTRSATESTIREAR
jgi:hypothetical protein